MTFQGRQDAGQKLGRYLAQLGVRIELVLGLPRGGVVVAAEVATTLNCALDVLVVRKIGHPRFREFAVGALSENDVVVLDDTVLQRAHVDRDELQEVIAEENRRLLSYQQKFALPHRPTRAGKSVVVVDDGLATGATLDAAIRSARQQEAQRVVAAVPVSSNEGAARISKVCDEFYALLIDPAFRAVGQYYESFQQTTDEEVLALLA